MTSSNASWMWCLSFCRARSLRPIKWQLGVLQRVRQRKWRRSQCAIKWYKWVCHQYRRVGGFEHVFCSTVGWYPMKNMVEVKIINPGLYWFALHFSPHQNMSNCAVCIGNIIMTSWHDWSQQRLYHNVHTPHTWIMWYITAPWSHNGGLSRLGMGTVLGNPVDSPFH